MQNNFIYLFCFLLLLSGNSVCSQDFSEVDAEAHLTPFPKNQDVQSLANALCVSWTTEKEKVRAIYVWIAINISYDVQALKNRKKFEEGEHKSLQEPVTVLRNKKAVCEGYSNLFNALCKAAGIEAIQVTGITKNHKGRITRLGHAWNLARIDGQWRLFDVTWGAGDVDTDEDKYVARFKEDYFCTAPEVMILNHYPEDPLFQLLPVPLTLDEFKQERDIVQIILADRLSDSTRTVHFVKDSLDAFARLDSVARYFDSALRALRYDPVNNRGLYALAMLQYNAAVDLIMAALDGVNRAAQSRDKNLVIGAFDRGIAQLIKVEEKLKACVASIEKITPGDFFKPSRQILAHARNVQKECARNRENLEKHRKEWEE